MKQFTRRNSKTQLQPKDTAFEQCPQQCNDLPADTFLQQAPKPVAASSKDPDPYSFESDDELTDRFCQPAVPGVRLKQPASQGDSRSKKACNSEAVRQHHTSPEKAASATTGVIAIKTEGQRGAAGGRSKSSSATASLSRAVQQASCPSVAASSAQCPPAAAAPPAEPQERTAGSARQRAAASGGSRSRAAAAGVGGPATTRNPAPSGGTSRRPSASGGKRGRAPSNSSGDSSQQHRSQQQQQPQLQPQRQRVLQQQPPSQRHPQLQGTASSPPEAVRSSLVIPRPGPSQPTPVSLPTPHRRPRLSEGLLAATSAAAGGGEARPAQTVMEAQERGELVQLQDDASYAMDGLTPACSIDTQRDSAITLTEMLSTRRGRLALRADGLAQQLLSNLAKLKAAKDCVLALASTLSLWFLTAEDANPCYLVSRAATVLFDQLLQYDYSFEEVCASGAAGSKLCRLVRGRPLAQLLASTGVSSTQGLLMLVLERATSSAAAASKASAVEVFKHQLVQSGAVRRLAQLVADKAASPGGPAAAAQQLHLMLLVLENATFTCPENGNALVGLTVTPGRRTGSKGDKQQQQQQQDGPSAADADSAQQPPQEQPFPAVLVGIARQLLQAMDQEQARAALHVTLSVLMNLIHDNRAGGALICSVGGMAVAADIFSTLLQASQAEPAALCAAVLQDLDLLSVALGVLINLVSNEPQHSRQLAAAGLPSSADSNGGTVSSFVQLLCTVISALGQLLEQHMEQDDAREQQQQQGPTFPTAAAAAGGLQLAGPPAGSRVVTSPGAAAEALGSNTASEASIVEVYAGMLLGFLVRDGGEGLAEAVAQLLPGRSLEPLTSATGRCLDFYVRAGAITEHTRVTLHELLQHLASTKARLQGADCQAAVPQQQQQQQSQGPDDMEIQ